MATPIKRTGSRRAPKSPYASPPADESFGENDDEEERRAARKAKAANERAGSFKSPFKSPGPARTKSSVPPGGMSRTNSRAPPGAKNGGKLSEDAMMDMYTNCIKLSADNVRSNPAAASNPPPPAAQRAGLRPLTLALACAHPTEN